ncbi:MAG: hypothetical protein ABIQ88_14975 [Chitinophagaceae bacterium]
MTVKDTSTEDLNTVFIPSDKELESIKQGIFVIKVDNKSTYHRWRDVWADNMLFKVPMPPHDQFIFRAVSITIPVYHEYGVVNSVYPNSFIYGVQVTKSAMGKTVISSIDTVRWM